MKWFDDERKISQAGPAVPRCSIALGLERMPMDGVTLSGKGGGRHEPAAPVGLKKRDNPPAVGPLLTHARRNGTISAAGFPSSAAEMVPETRSAAILLGSC